MKGKGGVMYNENRIIILNRLEHGAIINALNDKRNNLIKDNRSTDLIDDVLLKVIDAPISKKRKGKFREFR